ncbi:MAG: helix-turn-helix transcriptional regulator [Rhodobacteraceae bacterium]|nr:helix-turn-helix transcriptional regulator [Paracoccaceae bacterium]
MKGDRDNAIGTGLLAVLMAVQAICAAFFLSDIVGDLADMPVREWLNTHLSLELLANLTLVAAIWVEWRFLKALVARQARADRALSIASGALQEVMESHFAEWGLTPAEADVAAFTIKGFTIAEIARLRNSGEGTVKTHLNAIYRKAGVQGRGQLVSVLIEDLLDGGVAARPDAA